MLRSFSVSNCCGGQRPLSLTCWSKRPKKKRKDKKDCMKKRCSPFLALSFWLTRLLFSFAITEGRCLLSTGSLAVIRWTALYAASEHLPFSSLFFISRMILIYYWLSSSLPVGVFVSLCAAKAPHTSSRTAYFSFCFISSTFGPILKKGSEDGERKSLLYRHSANVDGAEKMMTLWYSPPIWFDSM